MPMRRNEDGRDPAIPAAASRPLYQDHHRYRLDLGALCEGTRIETVHGPVQIEQLQPGDLLPTPDRGPLPIVAIWAIPPEHAPDSILRMRQPQRGQAADLYALPSQAVHLQHGLEEVLFATRIPLARLSDLAAMGAADAVARHDRQLYRLDLGQDACITANGLICGLLSGQPPQEDTPGPIPPITPMRLLSRHDAIFAIKSRKMLRPRHRAGQT